MGDEKMVLHIVEVFGFFLGVSKLFLHLSGRAQRKCEYELRQKTLCLGHTEFNETGFSSHINIYV